jgi:hypothetical protein
MAATVKVKYYNTYVLKKINRGAQGISSYNWYVEESRIRGGYNNVQTGLSPRAFIVSEENNQQVLSNSVIYSGVINSRTGINQTNVFPSGEDITRSLDPSKGSVQKLHAEDNNLVIFQERKVNRALIDKDAIYTQEGMPIQTTSNVVIGQIQPYAGDFGISKNPESFAVYGYQKYFTDANKGSVLRLSMDGLTEISNYGMYDFFRDKLSSINGGLAVGGYDVYNKCYTLSIQPNSASNNYYTLSFDEQVKGWTSFYDYRPLQMFSIRNNFFTTSNRTTGEITKSPENNNGALYKHYQYESGTIPRARFYGVDNISSIETIFNDNPSLVKSFKTINYEGSGNWEMAAFDTDQDSASSISKFTMPTTLQEMQNRLLKQEFKEKDGKYFANIINASLPEQGEILYGQSMSGVKGFYGTIKMTATNTVNTGINELFAVSTNYSNASY